MKEIVLGSRVDVDEQTWLGCRAFVASTSSSLLNWVAFVIFFNIWPNLKTPVHLWCAKLNYFGFWFSAFWFEDVATLDTSKSQSENLSSLWTLSKDYLPAKKRRLYIQLVEAALYTGHHTSWRSFRQLWRRLYGNTAAGHESCDGDNRIWNFDHLQNIDHIWIDSWPLLPAGAVGVQGI